MVLAERSEGLGCSNSRAEELEVWIRDLGLWGYGVLGFRALSGLGFRDEDLGFRNAVLRLNCLRLYLTGSSEHV